MPRGSLRLRNAMLLLVSAVFYAWGDPLYLFLMLTELVCLWALGLLIHRYKGTKKAKLFLVLSIVLGLGTLGFFKYADFFLGNFNAALGSDIPLLNLALPLGISFYTFQMLSYSIDVYRGQAAVQRSLLDFSCYVMLFPQLIAGPIVRYADIDAQLAVREHSIARFAQGARRFVAGLAKKVLLANVFGELCQIMRDSGEPSVLAAWLYILAFALQVYFDFSGYSDMAIGLGRIFGFDFLENFRYPYIARSITDFWRRWHISLSTWFRDYLYIPLGGSRVKPTRFLLNMLIVWFATGFWHGAGWNFIVWGLYFGIVLLAEKFVLYRLLERLPALLRHVYVLLVVAIGWTLFDASDFVMVKTVLGRLFGFGASAAVGAESIYYLRSYMIPLLLGIFGTTPLPQRLFLRLSKGKAAAVWEPACVGVALILITAFLVSGSFNPFIYFRF